LNFRKKPSYSARDLGILGLIALVTIILGGGLIGANIALSRVFHGGGGFFIGLEAARAFLFEHTDPYSGTVASLAQELAYGRLARSGENPYVFAIPFFLIPVYFPFTLFTESASARGLWMFISEVSLAGTAFLALRLIEWQARRLFVVFLVLTSIFNYYSVAALLEGTPVIQLGLLCFGFLFAYHTGRDELAGALLVFAFFSWQVGSLFLILAIWKVLSDKRWRVFFGLGMTLVILITLSLLLYPGWMFSFMIALISASRSQFWITSGTIFARLSPSHGNQIALVVTILIIVTLFYEWANARRGDLRRFTWVACLTLAATPLIGFRTQISDLVVLFPGLTLIFAATTDRWRTGYWLTSLLLAIVLLVPWALYVQGSVQALQHSSDYLFLFCPVFSILGLYWIRWWFTRPPRTWLDQVRS
jgi:hypothetical protein